MEDLVKKFIGRYCVVDWKDSITGELKGTVGLVRDVGGNRITVDCGLAVYRIDLPRVIEIKDITL